MSMCHYLVSVSIFGFDYYLGLHIIPLELLRNVKKTERKIHCDTNLSRFISHCFSSELIIAISSS